MSTIFGILMLLIAVVAANVLHLLWPRLPLAIYQILAGIVLALIPVQSHTFELDPKTSLLLIIAPLLFNDGQGTSPRELSRNLKQMLSMAVTLVVFSVLVVGTGLHLAMAETFSLPLAFMLGAIIAPTDAVAVKSLSATVAMPRNVNRTLEHEALFNDASGLVLFGLATSTLSSGHFSLGQGIFTFLYVFLGGIIFGALIGFLAIQLRTTLMRTHVDIGRIVIPINLMTPIVTYWFAEELHLSGILAVVAAGIVHALLYTRLRLTSAKVQIASTTIWSMVADILNGLVFVFLGVTLPSVLGNTSLARLAKIFVVAIALYLVMGVLRYFWSQLKFVDLHSKKKQRQKDSFLLSLGGIHGTITLAMAFSIPHTINGQPLAARNTIILIAALVIIISITVGALAFPRILPAKKNSYRQSEFHYQLNKTVHYAIDQLANEPGGAAEKAVVLNVLSSQSTLTFKTNQARFQRIYDRAHEVELAAITKLSEEGKVTDKIARLYVGLISRELASHGDGLINFCRGIYYRIKWHRVRHRVSHITPAQTAYFKREVAPIQQQVARVFDLIYPQVIAYLNDIQTPANTHEVTMVRRSYFNRQRFFRQHEHLDGEQIDILFVAAFQFEHSYIQQAAAKGTISVELANALNEHISTDQLVYIQSTN